MTARSFLVRGLMIGVLAGFATFATAYFVGEPHVQTAINIEEANSAAEEASAPADVAAPADEGTTVSRHHQRTFGLFTGSLGVATMLGGTVALVAAGVVGRFGRLTPRQSTATVSLIGWFAVAIVPFMKYPATPPAVGDPDTIGARTNEYFAFVFISVLVALAATALALRLLERSGAFTAVVASIAAYVVVMVVVGQLMPAVNEVGAFPADTLWYFRVASLITLTVMWAVIGVGLSGLVGQLHARDSGVAARRALAASL